MDGRMGGWMGVTNATKSSAKEPSARIIAPHVYVTSVLISTLPGTLPAEEEFAESAAFLHKLRLSVELGEAK